MPVDYEGMVPAPPSSMLCTKAVKARNSTRVHPCLRVKRHKGRCTSGEQEAAEADGVHYCCRMPRNGNHRDECYQPY